MNERISGQVMEQMWGEQIVKHIQNEQNSSQNYQTFPIGLIEFPSPGRYDVGVRCMDGNLEVAACNRFTSLEPRGRGNDAKYCCYCE